MKMIKIKKKITLKENIDAVIQYYTNEQIIELLKQQFNDVDYYKFLKNITVNSNIKNKSIEEYLLTDVSKITLLNLIQSTNLSIYNNLLNEMVNNII